MRCTPARSAISETRSAFSLVEVVIAIAIVVFCLFSLLGLLTVGAQASRDSSEAVQAATVASLMVSERRAAPTNSFSSNFPTFPIAPLNNPTNINNIYLASDGTTNSSSQANVPVYRLGYTITTNANNSASLYFCLSWPAAVDPIANPTQVQGRYEVFTCIPLP